MLLWNSRTGRTLKRLFAKRTTRNSWDANFGLNSLMEKEDAEIIAYKRNRHIVWFAMRKDTGQKIVQEVTD